MEAWQGNACMRKLMSLSPKCIIKVRLGSRMMNIFPFSGCSEKCIKESWRFSSGASVGCWGIQQFTLYVSYYCFQILLLECVENLFIEFNLNFSYLALDRKGGGDVCFGKATAYDSTNDTHRRRNGRFNVFFFLIIERVHVKYYYRFWQNSSIISHYIEKYY